MILVVPNTRASWRTFRPSVSLDPETQYVSRLFVSVVTIGEIEFGHRAAQTPDLAKQSQYTTFVREQCPVSLEVVEHVARHYGKLKAWLFNNRHDKKKRTRAERSRQLVGPITAKELHADENDLWIAAQAMAFNLVLVTNDSRGNFGALHPLSLVDGPGRQLPPSRQLVGRISGGAHAFAPLGSP